VNFVTKQFRHQDTKTQRKILANSFALCLSGHLSGLSGLEKENKKAQGILRDVFNID
jgi:hypothetical protein